MPATSEAAIRRRAENRVAKRQVMKKDKYSLKNPVRSLIDDAVAKSKAEAFAEFERKSNAEKKIHEARQRVADLRINDLQNDLRKVRDDLSKSKIACKSMEMRLMEATKVISGWDVFWGWIESQAHPSTLKWLKTLRVKGPRRASDRCWGGGQ